MVEQREQLQPTDLKGIHFVFEMGLRKVDEQMEIIKDIESKMGILIGFIATFVALLVGFLLGGEPATTKTIHSGITPFFFYPFLLLLLLALIRCFQAFKIRDYFAAYHLPPMVEWANEEPALIKNAFIGGVLQAVQRNFGEIGRKRKYASQGTWLILFAVVLLFLVLVSLVVEGYNANSKATTEPASATTESPATAPK